VEEAGAGPAVSPGAAVSEAVEAVARSGRPARVVDRGRCVGVVNAAALLEVVAGTTTGPTGTARDAGAADDAAPAREEVA
jgi:glycine betaine/proline transport system ATP-binding protein